jgi:3-oxoadipate enol-lactonase
MLLPLNGRNLYYDLVGPESGAIVAFGHSLAADGGMWAEQVAALANAGYRALRMDIRGHGGSTPVAGPYTIDQLADDVIAIANAVGAKQFHFVGLSIGGMFGQSLGIRYGERLKSLMLCDTQAASPKDAVERWNPRIASVEKANSLEPLADATMGRWLTEKYKAAHPDRWKEIRDTIVGTSVAGYVGCSRAIQSFDFRPQLPTIKAPTMIVCGSDDPGAPPEEGKQIASLLPNGRYQEIADARHLPNVEFPELFNKMMIGWVKGNR